MIKSVMAKDYSSERQQILGGLLAAVKNCQTKFGTKNELATETDEKVASLCQILEQALSHGLRSKPAPKSQSALGQVSDLLTQPFKPTETLSFWHYVSGFLTKHELERYRNLRHVDTDMGRGRAWLRSALNERSLERYFSLMLANPEDALVYYHSWSLLLDQELNSTLPNISAGLGAILFAISIDEAKYNQGLPSSGESRVRSEPVLAVPIEEVPMPRKKKPINVVSFDDSDTASIDSMPEQTRVVTSQVEKMAVAVPGSSPSPSSNDSSLHDFEPSTRTQESLPTLTPVNDENNVGELMLLSIEGFPGDDVSLGPETEDIDTSNRIDISRLSSQDLESLYSTVESLQEANQCLKGKLKNLIGRHRTELSTSETKLLTLTRENEVLKHQLRKYVSAVQMLNKDGAAHEALTYLEASQAAAQHREETAKYEEQLIEVAQMHGELMEFNDHIVRSLDAKEQHIKRLEQELVHLRGPLPTGDQNEDALPPDALVHIWIPSAFLSGGSSPVVYQVYVRIKEMEWNIYRRYAEFYSLHKELKTTFPAVATYDFPPKKTIGNKGAKFVEQRRQKLQRYLRQAVDAVSRAKPELVDYESLINLIPFFSQTSPANHAKRKGMLKKRAQDVTPSAHYNGL